MLLMAHRRAPADRVHERRRTAARAGRRARARDGGSPRDGRGARPAAAPGDHREPHARVPPAGSPGCCSRRRWRGRWCPPSAWTRTRRSHLGIDRLRRALRRGGDVRQRRAARPRAGMARVRRARQHRLRADRSAAVDPSNRRGCASAARFSWSARWRCRSRWCSRRCCSSSRCGGSSSVSTGFDTRNLITFRVNPLLSGYTPERVAQYWQSGLDAIRRTSGVTHATVTTHPLIANASATSDAYYRHPDGTEKSALAGRMSVGGRLLHDDGDRDSRRPADRGPRRKRGRSRRGGQRDDGAARCSASRGRSAASSG